MEQRGSLITLGIAEMQAAAAFYEALRRTRNGAFRWNGYR